MWHRFDLRQGLARARPARANADGDVGPAVLNPAASSASRSPSSTGAPPAPTARPPCCWTPRSAGCCPTCWMKVLHLVLDRLVFGKLRPGADVRGRHGSEEKADERAAQRPPIRR